MKKLLAFLCLFPLLLGSGCSIQRINSPISVSIILMDRNSSDILQDAMTAFCENINKKSNGSLRFTIQYSDNASQDFGNGVGGFLFEDSRNIEALDANLRYSHAPFLYRNYNHFTMSIHSRQVVSLLSPGLSQRLNARPLAAFYRGNAHLLSTHPIQSDEDMVRLTEATIPPDILLTGKSQVTGEYFKAAGFHPIIISNVATRQERLQQGEFIFSEFTTAELSNLSWSDSKVYHIPSFHTVNMQVFLVNNNLYNTLSAQQQSWLAEEISYLYPVIEDYYLLRENMALGKLKEQGVVMSAPPNSLWNHIDRSASIIRSYDDFEEIGSLLYEAIREIGKTVTE